MESNNTSHKPPKGHLSVRIARYITYYYLNNRSISREEFYARLNQVEETKGWLKMSKFLTSLAKVEGILGTLLFILAFLLKTKGRAYVFAALFLSMAQWIVAWIMSEKGDEALQQAIDIYNAKSEG